MADPSDRWKRVRPLEAFDGAIRPVRVPLLYRVGLGAVTLAVVMLPLIYLGLIGALAFALWYHAVHSTAIFDGSGSTRGRLSVYLVPLFVGGVVLLFMVKPLFARQPRRAEPHRLDPATEPVLFGFVERLCAAVHAPAPNRIDVDCEVNASASFRRGLGSFFGSDLVLTIGLPLVRGLTLRQFAGVLAHEFGHFSQGAGMRLSYVIRSVNHWFSRVVFERDRWDLWLDKYSKGIDFRLSAVLQVVRFLVWSTRKLLHGLMLVGHAVSCFMMRQMEFDADRHEARLAGSETFAATALQLHLLNVAQQQSWSDLNEAYSERRLADDLPALIRSRLDRIPPDTVARVRESLATVKTGTFDTHPSDADRIASAAAEATPGIFRVEAPATVLFRDFDRLSGEVTRERYRVLLGGPVDESMLEPSERLMRERDRHRERMLAVSDYLLGAAAWERPRVWPTVEPAALDEESARPLLEAAREALAAAGAAARRNHDAWWDADRRRLNAGRAEALLEAGFRIDAADFALAAPTLAAARKARQDARSDAHALDEALEPFARAASERLALTLAARGGSGRPLTPLIAALDVLRAGADGVDRLRHDLDAVEILFHNLAGNENQPSLVGEIRKRVAGIHQRAESLREPAEGVVHPYQEEASLADFWIGAPVGDPDDAAAVCACAQGVVERAQTLYYKILGSLVAEALPIEARPGLAPLRHEGPEGPAPTGGADPD